MTTPSTVIPTNVVSTTTFTTTTISRYSETALLFRSGNEFSTPPPPSTVSMSAPPSTLSTTSSPTIVSVQEMSVFASMGKNTSAGNTSPFEAHINTFLMLFDDLTKLNSTELIQKYSAPCLAGWLVPKVFNTVDRFFLHRVRQKFDIPKNFWFFNALGCSVLNCFLYLFIKKCCGVKIFNVFTPSGQRHVPDEQVRAILARSETLPMNVLSPKRDCSSRASINSDLPEIVLVESPSLTPKSYKKDSCR